jgi:predicted  nucleic acid-binding Zn-ribbon protein
VIEGIQQQAGAAAGRLASLADGLFAAQVDWEQLKRDRVQPVKFVEHFRHENAKMIRRQSDLWIPILEHGTRHELYFEGHQTLTRGPNGYRVKEVAEENRHRVFVVNRIRPYSNEQAAIFMSVNPKVQAVVKDADPTREQRRIDAADALRDHLNYLWFTADRLQRWAKHAQFHGRYRAELWFDHDNQRGRELRPVYQQLQQTPRALVNCLECGELGEASPDQLQPGCAACGSPHAERYELPAMEAFEEQTGAEWQEAGEMECLFDPTWAARYSLTVGKDLSPWFYHERDEVRESVEAQYNVKLPPESTEQWQQEDVLRPGRILRRAEQQRARAGVGGNVEDECAFVQRFYYEPEMLHFVALSEPYQMPDGETIPAGIRLSEVFQGGLCIKAVPGSTEFLDVYRESHKKRFIEGEFDISPGKAIARGNREAPDYNKWTNVLLSGVFDSALKTLQPSLAVVDEVFPDGRLYNRDDRTIRVKLAQLRALGENARIGDAIGLMPSPGINNSVQQLVSLFTSEQRRASGTETYLNSEDQGVSPDTATAARIGEDRNSRMGSLPLSNFAVFQVRLFERGFELARENYGDVRLISVTDEQKRRRVAQELHRQDLIGALEFHIERDSWLPNLKLEQRAAFAEGVQTYVQAAQANLVNPQFVKRLNQVYGIDLMADRLNERVKDCEEILQEMLETVSQVQVPDQLYALNPVNLLDPHHEIKAMWYQDVLTRREAKAYHPFVLATLERYVVEHAQALMTMRGGLAAIAQIGQGLIAPPISAGLSAFEQSPQQSPINGASAGQSLVAETADPLRAGSGQMAQMFASPKL